MRAALLGGRWHRRHVAVNNATRDYVAQGETAAATFRQRGPGLLNHREEKASRRNEL